MHLLDEMVESEQRVVLNIDNTGDHDKFQHYFEKKAISENLMFGTPMKALCGKVVKQQVDPQGRTVCPMCTDVYENVVQKG